jgi:sec-independent protein translocase protein TatA
VPNIGPFELIIILVVVLLLFGTTRLPKLAKSLGEASKEFKKGVNDGEAPAKAVGTAPAPDETVTLTKAEYDALQREAEARRESPPTP